MRQICAANTGQPPGALQRAVELRNSCLRRIERFALEVRFNPKSHENERAAFHLWSILQLPPPSRFPLTPAALFVPLSSRLDPSVSAPTIAAFASEPLFELPARFDFYFRQ